MEQLIDIVKDYVGDKHAQGTAWFTYAFRPDKVPPGVLDGSTGAVGRRCLIRFFL